MVTPVNDRYEDAQGASLLAIDQYFRDVAWTKESPLSEEEEAKHFSRLARAKADLSNAWLQNLAKHSRDALIEAYQPFLLSMARRFVARASRLGCMDLLDLVSEANIGLLNGFLEYDVAGFENPRAFLLSCAYWAMRNALCDHGVYFRFTRRVLGDLCGFYRVKDRLFERFGRAATYGELAEELGVSVSKVAELAGYSSCRSVKSLQGLVEEEDCTDYYGYKSVFAPSDPDAADQCEENRRVLHRALDVLTQPQREVISQVYGFGEVTGECSRRDLAMDRGITKAGISKHEVCAIRHLRCVLELRRERGRLVCSLKDEYGGDYCTAKQVAQLLGRSVSTVLHWCCKGYFPGAIIRRISKPAVCFIPKRVVREFVASRFPDYLGVSFLREEVSA
jgi:RNA polymerase sigma factor (sigma-70 family)